MSGVHNMNVRGAGLGGVGCDFDSLSLMEQRLFLEKNRDVRAKARVGKPSAVEWKKKPVAEKTGAPQCPAKLDVAVMKLCTSTEMLQKYMDGVADAWLHYYRAFSDNLEAQRVAATVPVVSSSVTSSTSSAGSWRSRASEKFSELGERRRKYVAPVEADVGETVSETVFAGCAPEELVDFLGSGACYLHLVRGDRVQEVLGLLGRWPSMEEILALPGEYFISPMDMKNRRVSEIGGAYHVTVGPYDVKKPSVVSLLSHLGGIVTLPVWAQRVVHQFPEEVVARAHTLGTRALVGGVAVTDADVRGHEVPCVGLIRHGGSLREVRDVRAVLESELEGTAVTVEPYGSCVGRCWMLDGPVAEIEEVVLRNGWRAVKVLGRGSELVDVSGLRPLCMDRESSRGGCCDGCVRVIEGVDSLAGEDSQHVRLHGQVVMVPSVKTLFSHLETSVLGLSVTRVCSGSCWLMRGDMQVAEAVAMMHGWPMSNRGGDVMVVDVVRSRFGEDVSHSFEDLSNCDGQDTWN